MVRWKVGGKEKSKTLRTKALAENFLSDLRQAAKNGEPFDITTGLPTSLQAAAPRKTFFTFAQQYMEARWLHTAARTRETMTYALMSLVPALVKDLPGKPDDGDLRAVLRGEAHPVHAMLAAGVGPVGLDPVGADQRAVQHQVMQPVPLSVA